MQKSQPALPVKHHPSDAFVNARCQYCDRSLDCRLDLTPLRIRQCTPVHVAITSEMR